MSLHVKWKVLISSEGGFLSIGKIFGVAESPSQGLWRLIPQSDWRSLSNDEVRVKLDQASVAAGIICKEEVGRHLKENKFRAKHDLFLMPSLPPFKGQSPWLKS